MTYVSFPGLFGDKVFSINPVAFSVLGREIRWYGIIICLGIILTVLNTMRYAKKEGLTTDDVLDFALWAIPFGIVGARVYYVLTSLSEYNSFSEAIAIWNGGIAIYGAVIAGAITVFIVSKVKKIKFSKIADPVGASIFIGQFLGRWGNFCNGEAFGTLGEIDFLGKVIKTPNLSDNYFLRMLVNSESTFERTVLAHPTFLYESLWNVIGFVIAGLIYRKKKFDGQIALFYFGWYGLGRFFIEGLRTDSLYLGNTGIRISQLLALITFLAANISTIIILVRNKKKASEDQEYVNQFDVSETDTDTLPSSDSTEESTQETDLEEDSSHPAEEIATIKQDEDTAQEVSNVTQTTDTAEETSPSTEKDETINENDDITSEEDNTSPEENKNGTDN